MSSVRAERLRRLIFVGLRFALAWVLAPTRATTVGHTRPAYYREFSRAGLIQTPEEEPGKAQEAPAPAHGNA